MIRIPGLLVRRYMASGEHDGIAFDGLLVDYAGMAGGATLGHPALRKRFHMFPMAHDQSHFLDRRGQVPLRNFGCPQDMPMTAETHLGRHGRLKVMRICGCAKERDHEVLGPRPSLVMDPTLDSGAYVTGHAGHFLVGRLGPSVM